MTRWVYACASKSKFPPQVNSVIESTGTSLVQYWRQSVYDASSTVSLHTTA